LHVNPSAGVPTPLARPRLLDPASDRLRALAGLLAHQLVSRQARNDQPEVDAIQQRPRELRGVGLEPVTPADALPNGVALEAARTRVRRSDEREPGRELDGPHHPGHHDAPVLHRLAQPLDRVAAELGELVQEQDAMMRERHLTGTQEARAAAEQRRRRHRVVRRAERSFRDEPAYQEPGHRMQLGDLERLVPRHRRQDRGEATCQHGLASAGRSHHQDVVSAGGGHLERPTRLRLATDLGEVDRMAVSVALGLLSGSGRGRPRAAQERDHLAERRRPDNLEVLDERRLGGVGCGDDHAAQARPGRRDRDREHPGCRNEPASQRELASEHPALERGERHLRGRGHHTHGDREVEPRAFLAQRARRQVHDDATQRPLEAGALDRRPDPVARLLDAGPRQAGQRQGRESSADVRLDGDQMTADPDDGDAGDYSGTYMAA
jgi:hypothetical protein